MALKIGRQGYLGLGIESTPGSAVAATTTVPFTTNTLEGKHTPIADIAVRGSRAKDYTSIGGKQWGDGEVDVYVDTLNAGFMFKLAMGNENVNTIGASVYDHIFYTTVSGNTPTTATIYDYKGVDTQQYTSMAVDKMDIEIKDSLMTAKVGFKGSFPTSGSFAPATVSGTLLPFSKYTLQLGSSLITAASSSAIPVTDFTLAIKNNAEVVFESGSQRASRVFWKEFSVTGSWTRFFESTIDRDNYYNLNKQSVILVASGTGLPGGYAETLTFNIAKCLYTDTNISTGSANFYAIKTMFTAEVDPLQGKQIDIILRNYRSSAYS